jgi:hypothetical protein
MFESRRREIVLRPIRITALVFESEIELISLTTIGVSSSAFDLLKSSMMLGFAVSNLFHLCSMRHWIPMNQQFDIHAKTAGLIH